MTQRQMERQTVFPALTRNLIQAFAEEPVLIDGMKLVFDEQVGLYPAAVEVTDGTKGNNGRTGVVPTGSLSRKTSHARRR